VGWEHRIARGENNVKRSRSGKKWPAETSFLLRQKLVRINIHEPVIYLHHSLQICWILDVTLSQFECTLHDPRQNNSFFIIPAMSSSLTLRSIA
jgi:hypothetical protein